MSALLAATLVDHVLAVSMSSHQAKRPAAFVCVFAYVKAWSAAFQP